MHVSLIDTTGMQESVASGWSSMQTAGKEWFRLTLLCLKEQSNAIGHSNTHRLIETDVHVTFVLTTGNQAQCR